MKNCATNEISIVGGSVDNATECVMRSFESYGDEATDNSILKEDKKLADIYGISIHPTITING